MINLLYQGHTLFPLALQHLQGLKTQCLQSTFTIFGPYPCALIALQHLLGLKPLCLCNTFIISKPYHGSFGTLKSFRTKTLMLSWHFHYFGVIRSALVALQHPLGLKHQCLYGTFIVFGPYLDAFSTLASFRAKTCQPS